VPGEDAPARPQSADDIVATLDTMQSTDETTAATARLSRSACRALVAAAVVVLAAIGALAYRASPDAVAINA
jgi:hypothetical protein